MPLAWNLRTNLLQLECKIWRDESKYHKNGYVPSSELVVLIGIAVYVADIVVVCVHVGGK